jgi:hypothetical protein
LNLDITEFGSDFYGQLANETPGARSRLSDRQRPIDDAEECELGPRDARQIHGHAARVRTRVPIQNRADRGGDSDQREGDPMAFYETLRRVLGGGVAADLEDRSKERGLGDAWGLNEVGSGADDQTDRPVEGTSAFDRRQWERKLKRILDELPASQHEWGELMVEAGALGFDPDWVAQRQRAEFALLVRRAVADQAVTEAEHRKLELARELIGIPEGEAELVLHSIVSEAETFFGKPVVEE